MSVSLSATARQARPNLGRPDRQTTPDHGRFLEIVSPSPARRSKPKTFYAVVTVATVVAIVVAQLLLSIAVSQGAYRIEALKTTKSAQQEQLQAATESLNELSSPQNLAANAHALGMVSTENPAFLRLSDGAVLGSPQPGTSLDKVSGNLIGNELLTDVPLVSGQARTGVNAPKKAAAQDTGAPSANTVKRASTPVPFKGALPSPATH